MGRVKRRSLLSGLEKTIMAKDDIDSSNLQDARSLIFGAFKKEIGKTEQNATAVWENDRELCMWYERNSEKIAGRVSGLNEKCVIAEIEKLLAKTEKPDAL